MEGGHFFSYWDFTITLTLFTFSQNKEEAYTMPFDEGHTSKRTTSQTSNGDQNLLSFRAVASNRQTETVLHCDGPAKRCLISRVTINRSSVDSPLPL